MTNLQKQIENLNNEMSSQLPKETLLAFSNSIVDLKNKGIENNCIKEGMKVPRFVLKSVKGTIIDSDNLFGEYDKIVIVFFRGVWCPYCNLELRALQTSLDKIENGKVKLLAVSPQKIKHSLSMMENNEISFDILFDENNVFAQQLDISFQLQDFVVPHYQQLGIDLREYNGDSQNTLPVPAVFVVDKNYNITYSFVDTNYMNRIDIDELIMNL
ncbi:Alkyl hydroperoxide reductase/ Thiol specific antioxidant/ Mal allergen [uncultured Dysgonomonas sp.]|uniref:Alkyl hydroperoxide reductase/ Thiol specific antioxidant/ Mal allergen n=1 Tax=uncultured Dysgonomonas sp. TaxID=206096 RepID=A0A212K196_9BACT|nr:peroxiredoxin-like family protein [uncultured Dysgonomonas sp.]SBW05494.1 Alkyl hydroperoxide reductase/ Thiol specific antioxidant/ Mal allergen [uncultured Dysgonomonas sp.]